MFTLAKLVFKSYMPLQLEKGMWFASKQKDIVYGKVYEYLKLYELTHVPQDMDSYIAINGAPVEPYIVQPMQNPDEPEQILATPDQIGWWDEGDTSDDLEDITPKIINSYIYGEDGENGNIALEVFDSEDEEGIHRNVVLFYNKVTIRHLSFVDEDDWSDEDEDWDATSGDGLEDEEDWDDMDDLTDYDNPEWPHDHPKDKTDHDPEPTDADHETQ
jgi:hypothetical protein